jgi:hypothetical protein
MDSSSYIIEAMKSTRMRFSGRVKNACKVKGKGKVVPVLN